jgi:hypothetical protein
MHKLVTKNKILQLLGVLQIWSFSMGVHLLVCSLVLTDKILPVEKVLHDEFIFHFSHAAKMAKLKELLHRSENRICADCSAPDPKWA